MELDCSEICEFLGAIEDGDVVEVNLTIAVCEIRWLKEVRDQNLAAKGPRIGKCHASRISASSDVYIAGEKEDFSAHINTAKLCGSGFRMAVMIAFQWLCKCHYTSVTIIAFHDHSLTIVDLDIGGRETKFVTIYKIET